MIKTNKIQSFLHQIHNTQNLQESSFHQPQKCNPKANLLKITTEYGVQVKYDHNIQIISDQPVPFILLRSLTNPIK